MTLPPALILISLSIAGLWAFYTNWVGAWRVVSLFFPPPENFSRFPRFQNAYRFFMKFVKYWGTVDARTKVYPSIKQHQEREILNKTGQFPAVKP